MPKEATAARLRSRLAGELGQEGPDRRGGQCADSSPWWGGESDQVAAVGAPGVDGGAGVGQVGEAIVQVPGERVGVPELLDDDQIHRVALPDPPGCQITGKRSLRSEERSPNSRYVGDRYLAR
ncbi:hypothetical protein [Nonomuraea sp. GTA35]|uniref:hypothetical protein n=1 Tax=Nonomuraea sp. GTA35 TaxID=1676746 RepID=UPI0035C1FA17